MKIPLSRPDITKKERDEVLRVLKTPHLALGPKLAEFEEKFASYIGTKYALAVNSGTSGLHLVIRALGIGRGDEVITTPFSFIASANCILYEGAKPVFTDIDPQTLNIDPNKIEKAITKKTKAILAVDIFGRSVNWTPILKIAKKHNLKVIEDSCEALGAEYKGKKCGTFGQAAVFAFYPNKQITTGEGGMIVTDNKKIIDSCRSMFNQGRQVKNGKWLEHVQLGYNYRMSDVNAALGLAQIRRVKEILGKRAKVAKMYNQELAGIKGLEIFQVDPQSKISWFVYVIKLSQRYSQKDRELIIKNMIRKGIQCANYFKPIHLQPFYRKMFGYKRGNFPLAESVGSRTIALPFYGFLKKSQIKYIATNLKKELKKKVQGIPS